VAQLKARNIQPVKVSAGSAIGELIASLQEELRSGPNAWLAQAMRRHTRTDAGRFDAMESEGWEE
jgi:nitrogen fixation protein NifX